MARLTCRCSNGFCTQSFKEAPPGSDVAKRNLDVHIGRPVGRAGIRHGPDVTVIQKALNRVPVDLGGPGTALKEDGIVGPKTLGAIEAFQRHHFGFSDGTVEVRRRTQAKLSSMQPTKLARMKNAVRFLNTALSCVTAAETQLLSARAGDPRSWALIERHFGLQQNSAGAQVDFVMNIYRNMRMVFARTGMFGNTGWSMYFEAEPFTNPGIFAFTCGNGWREMGQYGGIADSDTHEDLHWFRHDTVYLSGFFDRTTDDDRIQTLVHELSHFVGGASGGANSIDDHAYGDWNAPEMRALSTHKKTRNAECYGNFAFDARFLRSPRHM